MNKKTIVYCFKIIAVMCMSLAVPFALSQSHEHFHTAYGVDECPTDEHNGFHYLAHAATCESAGNKEFWACCNCQRQYLSNPGGTFIDAGVYAGPTLDPSHIAYVAPLGHDYDLENPVIVDATTDKEGSVTYTCKTCSHQYSLKIAKLTTLSVSGDYVNWTKVSNESADADQYKVLVDGAVASTLAGDVFTFKASTLPIGTRNIEVRAIFNDAAYIEGDGASMDIDVSHSSTNSLKVSNFTPVYSGAGTRSFVVDEGKNTLKLDANGGVNWNYNNYDVSTLYGVKRTFVAGTYRVEAEVKLGEVSNTQALYYGSYGSDAGVGWFPGYRYVISLAGCTTTEYTKVSTTFSIDSNKAGQPEVSFGSLKTALTANSFILIRNIKFVRTDISPESEEFNIYPRENHIASSWDNTGTFGCFNANTDFRLIDDNGNACLRIYTAAKSATFTLAADSSKIKTLGTYAMIIKVKLGLGATNVDNIGFRNSATGSGTKHWTGDNTFDLTGLAGSTDYVTLTKNIEVTDVSNTGYVNVDFWVFTHNDTIQSADNYVLIDDVSFNKVNVAQH